MNDSCEKKWLRSYVEFHRDKCGNKEKFLEDPAEVDFLDPNLCVKYSGLKKTEVPVQFSFSLETI